MTSAQTRSRGRPRAIPLILPLVALFTGGASAGTPISEQSITIPAEDLPEFKNDPHVQGSQGNQISGVVRVMHQDQRGWLWFGTQNGLARHDGTSLVYFDIRDRHGRGVTVRAIAEDRAGDLWFGTSGGITRYDGEFFTNTTTDDGLPSDDVWCLYADGVGELWIGTVEGVCRFDGATFTPFPLPPGKRNPDRGISGPHMVRWITEDRTGDMWFAAEGRVYRHDGRSLEVVPVMDDDSPTWVANILEDRSGNMWFATDAKGLIRFDGREFTTQDDGADLATAEVNAVYEDSRGRIWFTAEGRGVCRYDGSSVTILTDSDGLATRAVFSIMEDLQGRMWFVGFLGAYRYDGDTVVNVTRDGPW